MAHSLSPILCVAVLTLGASLDADRSGPARCEVASPGPALATDEDLEAWYYWWWFNQHRFRRVRPAHAPPTEGQILTGILPALQRTLERSRQRDLVETCMLAMARIGRAPDGVDLIASLRARLRDADPEVRSAAELAMGISRQAAAIPDLVTFILDEPRGVDLVGGSEVDLRTRAFAAYGLGLIGQVNADASIAGAILAKMRRVLEGREAVPLDLGVAAVNAIALLAPDTETEAGARQLARCFDALEIFWSRDLDVDERLMHAHVPPAVAKLCEGLDLGERPGLRGRLDWFRREWLEVLRGEAGPARDHPAMLQSAVLALGLTTGPGDGGGGGGAGSLDVAVVRALREVHRKSDDRQSVCFALMALGEIGGDQNRTFLLGVLRTETKSIEQEWAALALGVLAFHAREAGGPDAPVDPVVGARLLAALRAERRPATTSALAIALGLAGYSDSAGALRELLQKHENQHDLAACLCTGLALMKDTSAVAGIRGFLEQSTRHPDCLRTAALALGELGDPQVVPTLVAMLDGGDGSLARWCAVAAALSVVGDGRAVAPLVELLADEKAPDLRRAFAASALAGIADRGAVPWNTPIGANINYRAAVPTLTNNMDGILDFR